MATRKIKNMLFFWRKDFPLSNHAAIGFTVKDIYFGTLECFLMYCKAKMFGDEETAQLIWAAGDDPVECKRLGRLVKGYVDEVWCEHRERIAYIGQLYKYMQNSDARACLLNTHDLMLVEASPPDRTWGIGMGMNDPHIEDMTKWGLNLHGKTTMRARQYFKEIANEVPAGGVVPHSARFDPVVAVPDDFNWAANAS